MRKYSLTIMGISDEEATVILAALVAMTIDDRRMQDALTEEQWQIAERLTSEFISMEEAE